MPRLRSSAFCRQSCRVAPSALFSSATSQQVWRERSPFLSTPPADLRDREFAKILLIKLSAIGDVVHTIPVLNKLRRRFPAAQLDWLVTPALAGLFGDKLGVTE